MLFVSLFKRGALRAVTYASAAATQAGRLAPPFGGEGLGDLWEALASGRPLGGLSGGAGRATCSSHGRDTAQAGLSKQESGPAEAGAGLEPAWRRLCAWGGSEKGVWPLGSDRSPDLVEKKT